MKQGMMWFDNDTTSSFADRLKRGVEYYKSKYYKQPDLCYVNYETGIYGQTIAGIDVRLSTLIQPNHFWIGINEETEITEFPVSVYKE